MRNSIVSIESVSNNSFGTGFVIESDEKGVYILTCQHVVDDVETPVVENVLAKVIAKGGFIDMALLYVSKLHLEPLPLQEKECNQLDVEVIGFSHFNQSLTQKKHIKATLYQELIELHSKEEDAYYNVRKIKANDGFNFDRGNSGSPVICKSSGNVIAMISNKEGNDIGYAIDIVNLKEVWSDVPSRLFKKPRAVIEPVSGTKEEATTEVNTTRKDETLVTTQSGGSSMVKYFIALAIILGIGFGTYTTMVKKDKEKQEEAAKKREIQRQKELLEKILKYEKSGFQALMDKKYTSALNSFKYANRLKPNFHHLSQITALLSKNIGSMNTYSTKRKVFDIILNKYTQYAPKGFIENIRKQIKLPVFRTPVIPHREPVIIKRPELKVRDLKELKVIEKPKLDLSKVRLQELQKSK